MKFGEKKSTVAFDGEPVYNEKYLKTKIKFLAGKISVFGIL